MSAEFVGDRCIGSANGLAMSMSIKLEPRSIQRPTPTFWNFRISVSIPLDLCLNRNQSIFGVIAAQS